MARLVGQGGRRCVGASAPGGAGAHHGMRIGRAVGSPHNNGFIQVLGNLFVNNDGERLLIKSSASVFAADNGYFAETI